MAAVRDFLDKTDLKEWNNVFDLYELTLKEKSKKKSKPDASKELIALDKWFQSELPAVIASRSEKFITSEELVQLMKWKLSRGKFRPRLVELAGSNAAELVEKTSKSAFKQVEKGNLKGAIDGLSKLRGIGPATASAILAAGCPDNAAFMADEPTTAILGQSSLKYNAQEYLAYAEGINDVCERLNKQDEGNTWTPHKVELALCVFCIASQLKPELLKQIDKPESDNNNKRKSTGADEEKIPKKKKQ